MDEFARSRLCTLSIFLANGFGEGVWSVEIARVQTVVGASDFELGLSLLVFAVTALGAMQVSGRLSARYPVNRVCAAFGVAFAITLASLGFAQSVAGLIGALVFFGIAVGGVDVAQNARASRIERRAGRPLMSSFHAAWSIGGAAGAGLAGLLAATGSGPAIVLPVAAIIALPGLLSAIGGRERPEPGGDLDPTNPSSKAHPSETRRLVIVCVIAFLAMLTEGALANWSSIYLQGVLTGLSGGFAIGYAAFSAGMSVSRLGGDWCVARYGRCFVGSAGSLLAALAFAVVLSAPSYASACVCFALIGLGLGNLVPITLGTAGRTARSEAVGVSRAASAGYTGFVVGPPLIGGLASLSSLPVALTLLIATTALMAALGLPAFQPGRRSSQD